MNYGEQTTPPARLDRRRFLVGAGISSLAFAGWKGPGVIASAIGDATPTARPLLDDDSSTFYRGGWATDFSIHDVPLDEIRSGGPGKDGIPPIDSPSFVSIADADEWIDDREPVILVQIESDDGQVARAYPLQIMIWHEIVNDNLGGQPILVTFCPLCNTAIAFDRRLDGSDTVYDFGTTGNLRHSDLVMWDRQTESWWQQITGEAIVGELTGKRLTPIPAQILGWETFKQEFPDADVLSRDTGFDRTYGRNPYPGYDDVDSFPFLFTDGNDERLPAMQRVVGVDGITEQVAFVEDALMNTRVVNDTVAGTDIVVFWAEGAAAATDQSDIADSRDVGQSGVFLRTIDGETLTFESTGDGRFRDRETGTTWSVAGRGLDGPLADASLAALPHVVVFWFAWGISYPETRIWNG